MSGPILTAAGYVVSVADYHRLARIGMAVRDLDGRYYVSLGSRIVSVTVRGECVPTIPLEG